jgi:hypothetical protein
MAEAQSLFLLLFGEEERLWLCVREGEREQEEKERRKEEKKRKERKKYEKFSKLENF